MFHILPARSLSPPPINDEMPLKKIRKFFADGSLGEYFLDISKALPKTSREN